MSHFPKIITEVIKHEGTTWVKDNNNHYVKFGLNTAFYPEVHADTTLSEAIDIYRRKLWDARRMGEIADYSKAYAAFDASVQHGAYARLIQRALNWLNPGVVVEDGKWGPATRAAINAAPATLPREIAIERWYYVTSDPATRNANLGPWLPGIKKRYMTWASESVLDAGLMERLRQRKTASGSTPILIFAGVGFLLYTLLN